VDLFLFKYQSGGSLLYECPGFQITDNTPASNFQDGADNCTNSSTGQSSATLISPATGWQPVTSGSVVQLRAANINGSGPAFWAVSSSGQVQAWTLPEVTANSAPLASQTLLTPAHAWRIGDNTTNSSGNLTAADTGTSSTAWPMTSSGNVSWNTDPDVFTPAANFGGGTGYMSESAGGFDVNGDFSISTWVKPATLGGAILSQNGNTNSCIDAYISDTTINGVTYGQWNLGMPTADSTSATWATATSGTSYYVKLGVWTHLTITWDQSTKFLRLYVNGIPAAAANPTGYFYVNCGHFTLGRLLQSGEWHGYFTGEIADTQIWTGTNQALTPTQVAAISGSHGYTLFPSDGTSYGTSALVTHWSWTTVCGQLSFVRLSFTITQTCTGSATTAWGTIPTQTSTPGGLTLQGDGNFVIRNSAGTAVWASGTSNNPGDVMIFQPDGNLVIYTSYGKALWSTNTQNMAFDA